MRFTFWSLGRSGLFPVSGRPSLRTFCAAVRSCGAPRPTCYFDRTAPRNGSRRTFSIGIAFSSGSLFRCWFLVTIG